MKVEMKIRKERNEIRMELEWKYNVNNKWMKEIDNIKKNKEKKLKWRKK